MVLTSHCGDNKCYGFDLLFHLDLCSGCRFIYNFMILRIKLRKSVSKSLFMSFFRLLGREIHYDTPLSWIIKRMQGKVNQFLSLKLCVFY